MSSAPSWKDTTELFRDTCKGMTIGQMIHGEVRLPRNRRSSILLRHVMFLT